MYRIMHMLRTLRENTSADMYEVYDNGISFLNFYGGDWFRKFVEYYYPDRTDYNFVFSSVNGKRTALSKYKGKKIFFSGENVEPYIKHTVRDFTEKAFKEVGINIRWEGEGVNEKGYDIATGKMLVCVNEQWFRPTDVDNLWGDPTKAKTVLGWNPQKTSYEELIRLMVRYDYELAKREAIVLKFGNN